MPTTQTIFANAPVKLEINGGIHEDEFVPVKWKSEIDGGYTIKFQRVFRPKTPPPPPQSQDGTRPMTIDPKDLRSGDKFTVEFVVPDLSTVATHPVLGALEGGRRHYFKHSDITSITRAPEPLKVGDRVSWGHKLAPYRLVAIDGDFAWVRAVDGYGQQLIRFSDLERIP